MRLLLTDRVAQRLARELRRAGRREIGGLLMGEHLQEDVFRLADITVQRSGGSSSCFVRHPREHQAELEQFFERTGGDYTRFNYLGEWHSHPSFLPVPSEIDLLTMQSLVGDPSVGANFLVLMIVKLEKRREMQVSATAFRPATSPVEVAIDVEPGSASEVMPNRQPFAWIRRLLGN